MNPTLLERNKKRLIEMRQRLIREVNSIAESIIEDVRAPGDGSNAPTHLATIDDEGVDRNVALARNEASLLEEVEAALGRIEQGIYGRCEDCGREIASQRLEALPFTRWCIDDAPRHDQIVGVAP